MHGRRVDRLEEQLRIELSEIIEHELHDPRIGLIAVTGVKVTPDLGHARVSISVLGGPDDRKRALLGLRSAAAYTKRSLAKRLHHLKRVPDLTFDYDDSVEQETRMEQLFDQIKTEE